MLLLAAVEHAIGKNFLFLSSVAATPGGRTETTEVFLIKGKMSLLSKSAMTYVGSTGLTYTFTILKESERSVPRVQMDSNDGSLSKPRREAHFVPFMMQQAWQKADKGEGRSLTAISTFVLMFTMKVRTQTTMQIKLCFIPALSTFQNQRL